MKIKITADSTCDLSPELLGRHGVRLIPFTVIMGDSPYLDGETIHPADLFEYFDRTGEVCGTSATNAARYASVFASELKNCDAVIHIGLGSRFSGTLQNARMAAAELGNVWVIDSENLSSGSGHTVLDAAELAESGAEPAEIAEILSESVKRVEASFVIDTLKYLRKGGRCSALAALGANLLAIKPCIEVSDGAMNVGKKYRGVYDEVILKYVRDRLEGRTDIDYSRAFITHPGCEPHTVALVRAEVERLAGFREIIETRAGCTVAAHCGPCTLGVLFKRTK